MKGNGIKANNQEIEQIKNKVKKAEKKKKITRIIGMFFLYVGAVFYSCTVISPVFYILSAFSVAVGLWLIIKTYIRKKLLLVKHNKHKTVSVAGRDAVWETWNPVERISECRRLCSAVPHYALQKETEKFFSGDKEFFGSRYNKWGIIWLKDSLFDGVFYDLNEKVFFSAHVENHDYGVEYIIELKSNVLNMLAQDIYNIRRINQLDELPATVAAAFTIADSLEVNSDIKEYTPPVDIFDYVIFD